MKGWSELLAGFSTHVERPLSGGGPATPRHQMSRVAVEQALMQGLQDVGDADAWPVLVRLYDWLTALTPTYPSLRFVLDRARERFPTEPPEAPATE